MAPRTLLERVFRRVVAARFAILAAYALLVPIAAFLATRIPSEGGIGRLIVASDPDVVATRKFQQVFPEGQLVVLLLEADDPFRPEVLAEVDALEAALRAIPKVTVYSALDVFRRARPAFDEALSRARLGAVTRIRKVGAPYVEAWIEHASGRASLRYFPVFGVLVVGIALFLYRSARSLLAILLALGTAVALGVGAGALLGFSFTIVSALVPLTVLVTALASLVYIHSRFMDQPEGVPADEHQIFALTNKFLPVTASSVAAVLGFAEIGRASCRE